jgi:hypothetical protein
MRKITPILALPILLSLVSSADAEPCEWSELGTIVTPAHVQELRECMDNILQWRNTILPSTCSEHWSRGGTAEDTFPIPECVRRAGLIVEADGYVKFRFRVWRNDEEGWQTWRETELSSARRRYEGYFNIGSIEWVYIGWELGDLTWKLESVGAEPDAN